MRFFANQIVIKSKVNFFLFSGRLRKTNESNGFTCKSWIDDLSLLPLDSELNQLCLSKKKEENPNLQTKKAALVDTSFFHPARTS